MRYFPVFLDLDCKTVFIAGGGAAAANKLRLFAKTGATIRCVALAFNEEMQSMSATGRAVLEYADPLDATFDDAILVIAATESDDDALIARRANDAGILVNAVDKTGLCDFITPSIVDRGRVVVAVGTEGSAPVLARRLREQIEVLLPENLNLLSQLIGANRERAGELFPQTPARREFWESVVDGEIGRLALSARMDEAQAALDNAMRQPYEAALRRVTIIVSPTQADDLTLGAVRALQDADLIVSAGAVPAAVLDRARRDSARTSISRNDGELDFIQSCIDILKAGRERIVLLLPPSTSIETVSSLKKAAIENRIEPEFCPIVRQFG